MNTKNMILLAVLALQVALAVVALKPNDRGSATVTTFLAGIAPDRVTELAINDEKSGIVLKKTDAGWQVTDAGETYPADREKILALVAKLADLESSRPVTRTRSSHARLKVSETLFQRRITVTAGDTTTTLYLGTSPSYKTLHVRAGAENEVYLVKDLTAWDIQANRESWWQTRLIDLPDNEISAISLTNKKGSFRLLKDKAGDWRLEGKDALLDPAGVAAFLGQAGHVSVLQFLGREQKPEYGLANPLATLTVVAGEKSYSLAVGGQNKDESNHVVKAEHSPFYASIADYVAEPLLTKTGGDFPLQPQDSAETAKAAGDQRPEAAGAAATPEKKAP